MKNNNRKYLYPKDGYLYFRYKGKLTPLPTDQTSAEFRRCYAACLASVKKPKPSAATELKPRRLERVSFIGGTVGAGIDKYIDSLLFRNCKPRSQYNYRKALDIMRDYIGTTILADIDVDAVDIYSEMVTKQHAASTADQHVFLLSNIWKVCRKHPEFNLKGKSNPTVDAEKRYKVRKPHQPWSDDAEDRFMETAPEYLRRAKLLLHFGAQRGGDCVKMLWDDFDGRGLFVTPEKTDGNPNPEPNYHLCPKPLLDALKAAPREAETILVNKFRKPWANATTLSHAIRNHLIKIGLAKRGTRTISMHGLRKNAASDVGSLGVGVRGIKTITGHRSNRMAEYYAQHAETRAINEAVVEQWNAAIEAKEAGRVDRRRTKIRRVK